LFIFVSTKKNKAMNTTNEKIIYPLATRVERVGSGGYVNGKRGAVIEVKEDRRRIKWDDGSPRTWINIKFLKPAPQTL
jgi:hypothetical protein